MPDGVENYGRFYDWQKLCRYPLIWLGCEDPCKSRDFIKKSDPQTSELKSVITAWNDAYGNAPITVNQVIKDHKTVIEGLSKDPKFECFRPDEKKNLHAALTAATRTGRADNARVVGKYISSKAGVLIRLDDTSGEEQGLTGEWRFVNAGTSHSASLWKIQKVET